MDKKMVDLSDLDKLKNKIDYQGKKLLNIRTNICLFDTFCIAQLNRSLNLIDAFIVLSKMNNYITSLALVRIHLDTLLRLYAVKLTQQDVNQVVEKMLNGKPIKKFKDGSFLEYDQGRFDEWCVYLKLPNGKRYPPHDTDYFQTIIDFATKYGRDRVYADYVSIYDITGREITVLANGNYTPGTYEINFNASALSSGVYFYKLQTGSFTETKKMLLVR